MLSDRRVIRGRSVRRDLREAKGSRARLGLKASKVCRVRKGLKVRRVPQVRQELPVQPELRVLRVLPGRQVQPGRLVLKAPMDPTGHRAILGQQVLLAQRAPPAPPDRKALKAILDPLEQLALPGRQALLALRVRGFQLAARPGRSCRRLTARTLTLPGQRRAAVAAA